MSATIELPFVVEDQFKSTDYTLGLIRMSPQEMERQLDVSAHEASRERERESEVTSTGHTHYE